MSAVTFLRNKSTELEQFWQETRTSCLNYWTEQNNSLHQAQLLFRDTFYTLDCKGRHCSTDQLHFPLLSRCDPTRNYGDCWRT
jgi:hypothetical protein